MFGVDGFISSTTDFRKAPTHYTVSSLAGHERQFTFSKFLYLLTGRRVFHLTNCSKVLEVFVDLT